MPQYTRRMRVTVIAAVTASNFEQARLKLDQIEVSRAVRPPVKEIAAVAVHWHGTRSDPVQENTIEQAFQKAWIDDLREIAREGEFEFDEYDKDIVVQ